jgi:plasmid stabilization system protein ParE
VSIVISGRAQADIDIASEELAEDYGVSVAESFQHRLQATLRRLERMPLSGELVDPPYLKHPGLRLMLVTKFKYRVIYYVPTSTGIRVVRVIHAGMDADSLFG